jgi:hypothetical protein
MRKPDWRDGWAISALCAIEIAMYFAIEWPSLYGWIVMVVAALILVTWWFFKEQIRWLLFRSQIQKGPPSNSKGATRS